jgi:hypothetical protein
MNSTGPVHVGNCLLAKKVESIGYRPLLLGQET